MFPTHQSLNFLILDVSHQIVLVRIGGPVRLRNEPVRVVQNLFDSFFRWEEERCSWKFDCLFRCFDPLSRHLTEAKQRMELFRRVQRFWQRKVWTQRHSRGEKLRCKFLARKSAKLTANSSATKITSLPSLSLSLSIYLPPSLSLSLSLSLSHRAHLTHNIGSASYHKPLDEKRTLRFFFIKNDVLHLSKNSFFWIKSKKPSPIPKICQFLQVATHWDWLQDVHLVARFSKTSWPAKGPFLWRLILQHLKIKNSGGGCPDPCDSSGPAFVSGFRPSKSTDGTLVQM